MPIRTAFLTVTKEFFTSKTNKEELINFLDKYENIFKEGLYKVKMDFNIPTKGYGNYYSIPGKNMVVKAGHKEIVIYDRRKKKFLILDFKNVPTNELAIHYRTVIFLLRFPNIKNIFKLNEYLNKISFFECDLVTHGLLERSLLDRTNKPLMILTILF